MDEGQLLDNRRIDDERIQVGLAHAAVEVVERERERQPIIDNPSDVDPALRIDAKVGGQRATVVQRRVDLDPEGTRHLDRVDDVQVVRPGLGEILPGMRRRVGRDETLLSVGRRSCAVVALQGPAIVLPLISEDGPAGIESAAIAHKQIPVVVADLMPEVAE
jgi:hypothetical protein